MASRGEEPLSCALEQLPSLFGASILFCVVGLNIPIFGVLSGQFLLLLLLLLFVLTVLKKQILQNRTRLEQVSLKEFRKEGCCAQGV